MSPELQAAYATCRAIARREAKNFYYAFIALPEAKRNAICAVYAFMRHADDVADDESVPRAERRTALAEWLEAWHAVLGGRATSDPVFLALADARQRFDISPELLDQVVRGTTMDLESSPDEAGSGLRDTYATFDELYRYCYYVASVVGLVCIRIFGYSDARAEKLAEETGIAFQLTNILRDVREDAERGRLYLPLADLRRFHVAPEEIAAVRHARQLRPEHRRVLQFEAERAHGYYRSAYALLPLISPDSRPALWVLVTIYRALLGQIESRGFDVFSERIRLSTRRKLTILARGIFQVLLYRMRGRRLSRHG